ELHELLFQAGTHLADAESEQLAERLRAHLLAGALGAVTRQRVRDFVAHDHGDAVVVLGDRHDAFPERDLAAGKREGVDLFSLDHVKLSLVLALVRRRRDTPAHALELRLPIGAGSKPAFSESFFISLVADLLLLSLRHDDELRAAGSHGGFTGRA